MTATLVSRTVARNSIRKQESIPVLPHRTGCACSTKGTVKMSDRPPTARRRSISSEPIIEPHVIADGVVEQVVLDANGHLLLITNTPVTLERLSVTHPHLTDMTEAALWRGDQ
jgi:hypothetical protein